VDVLWSFIGCGYTAPLLLIGLMDDLEEEFTIAGR
jgi:hypothetical protein